MKRFIPIVVLFALLVSMIATQQPAIAASLPCDIYAAGGTACVAAHSTVRALFGAYSGRLYQVRRASDNATTDIGTLTAGGFANAAAQDSFCAGTSCLITIIYDQSSRGNHLTQAPGGGAAGGPDNLANAAQLPLTVSGHKVYGVFVAPGTGYRDNTTSGIATGDAAEGMYAVLDGTHYNGGCCFDYGNAETSSNDTGNGHMEAIYFGNIKVWGFGSGSGPWVMADLENGLFSGVNAGLNSGDPSITWHYVTAIIKGTANLWAIRAGNAQSGGLSTFYSGSRPNVSGYNPMHKEGAIILGIGGDNSKGSAGSFFEGAMTSGYPSDATENSVQANIVATYGATSSVPTNTPAPGTFPVAGTQYRLINRNSGKVADVSNRSLADGGDVIQWSSNGGSNQQWSFVSVGGGFYKIVNRNSGKLLDVSGKSTVDGGNIIQWTDNGGTNQQWSLTSLGGGYYRIINRNSGKDMDVANCGTTDGTDIRQWTWLNNNCQQWQIVP